MQQAQLTGKRLPEAEDMLRSLQGVNATADTAARLVAFNAALREHTVELAVLWRRAKTAAGHGLADAGFVQCG